MIETFLIKLTQFDETGPKGIILISLGYLIIKFHFRKKKSITFFVTFTLFLFDSGVCLSVRKGNELNLKINQKSNRKNKFGPEQIV